ncbi:hypothetical protein GCM10009528_40090 [Kineococcus aurantiacus]
MLEVGAEVAVHVGGAGVAVHELIPGRRLDAQAPAEHEHPDEDDEEGEQSSGSRHDPVTVPGGSYVVVLSLL